MPSKPELGSATERGSFSPVRARSKAHRGHRCKATAIEQHQGFVNVRGFLHPIAILFENFPDKASDKGFVVDDEDHFEHGRKSNRCRRARFQVRTGVLHAGRCGCCRQKPSRLGLIAASGQPGFSFFERERKFVAGDI
jgi:hypothetical protein